MAAGTRRSSRALRPLSESVTDADGNARRWSIRASGRAPRRAATPPTPRPVDHAAGSPAAAADAPAAPDRPPVVGRRGAADPERALETAAEAGARSRDGAAARALRSMRCCSTCGKVAPARSGRRSPRKALAAAAARRAGAARRARRQGAVDPDRARSSRTCSARTAAAEVPFLADGTAQRRDRSRIAGRIDRLVVDARRGADGRLQVRCRPGDGTPTSVKPAYLTQLGLYALVAGQLFPGHEVEAAILWTSLESLIKLPRRSFGGSGAGLHHRGDVR